MLNVVPTPTGVKLSTAHGSVCLSTDGDKLFVHDLEGDGQHGSTMLTLWTELQKLAVVLGFKELYAHIDPSEERLLNVYTKRGGMEPVSLILKKDLSPYS